jgi:5-methylcytosine-specific restriction endonuclease McrA
MTKIGTKLSEEHKKNIGNATKKMWKNGVFDSEKIRDIWRKTALSGIARKGRQGPNKRVPSQEMLDDLSKMGDKDFMTKWNVSRVVPIKLRKRYGIQSFNKQHGTIEHQIENGVEYKWCQKEHWEPVSNFGKNKTRWDGLRGWCKDCESQNRSEMYDKNDGAAKMRRWLQTETGRNSRSATMRKTYEKRRGCYVKFDLQDEKNTYDACGGKCVYCKVPVEFSVIEFDHFIPVKLGGKTEVSNMLPACKSCNNSKRAKPPEEWIIKKFGQVIGKQIYNECLNILSSLHEKEMGI